MIYFFRNLVEITDHSSQIVRQTNFTLDQNDLNNQLEEIIKSMRKREIVEIDIEKDGISSKFIVKLLDIQTLTKNDWGIENDNLRAENANKLKLNGNNQLKDQKFEEAKKIYYSAVSSIQDDDGPLFNELKLNLSQNLLLAYLKLKEFDKSKVLADKLLSENSNNIKVLYRRALSYMGLGDFENAKKDLNLALNIEPNNQEVINELRNIKERQKIQKEKEKAVFGKMFGN